MIWMSIQHVPDCVSIQHVHDLHVATMSIQQVHDLHVDPYVPDRIVDPVRP